MPELNTLGAPIKAAYESQTNTNPFTDAAEAKLAGIQAGAQVNPENISAFDNDAGYVNSSEAETIAEGVVAPIVAEVAEKISSDITGYSGAGVITNEIFCTQAQYDTYAATPPANFATTKFVITDA